MNTKTKLFSPNLAVERLGGDMDLLAHLIHIFLDEVENYKAQLKTAHAAGSQEGINNALHKVKGACSTVGAMALFEMTDYLEENPEASTASCIEAVETLLDNTCLLMKHWLIEHNHRTQS